MTDDALTKERNIFVWGFLGLIVAGPVLGLAMMSSPYNQGDLETVIPVIVLALKAAFVYLTFRLSRFLHQPPWLTGIYCVLAPFSLLYLVPFIGLLVGVKKARGASSVSSGLPVAVATPVTSALPVPVVTPPPVQATDPAQAIDRRFCTSCGASARADYRFCHSCGQALPADA